MRLFDCLKQTTGRFFSKIFFMVMVCGMMALFLNSCTKTDDLLTDDNEGIPGLGNAAGEPTGTKFKLPDGIELTGNITGADYTYEYWVLGAARSERIFFS